MRVFVNSFPKSGTNLVEKLMHSLHVNQARQTIALSSVLGRHQTIKNLLRVVSFSDYTVPIGLPVPVGVKSRWLRNYVGTVPDDAYFTGHAAWSEYLDYLLTEQDIRVIQVIRDPRAILYSNAQFCVEPVNSWHPFYSHLRNLTEKERIAFFVRGAYVPSEGMYYSGFVEVLKRLEGWFFSGRSLVVRFEDLVGSKGGGDDDLQYKTIDNIAKFVGRNGVDIKSIQDDLFGGTKTFRGGRIDRWRNGIDDDLNTMILETMSGNDILVGLGYSEFF